MTQLNTTSLVWQLTPRPLDSFWCCNENVIGISWTENYDDYIAKSIGIPGGGVSCHIEGAKHFYQRNRHNFELSSNFFGIPAKILRINSYLLTKLCQNLEMKTINQFSAHSATSRRLPASTISQNKISLILSKSTKIRLK